jgi:hypothetical protein
MDRREFLTVVIGGVVVSGFLNQEVDADDMPRLETNLPAAKEFHGDTVDFSLNGGPMMRVVILYTGDDAPRQTVYLKKRRELAQWHVITSTSTAGSEARSAGTSRR